MVAAHEDESDDVPHPYWYARVIGIFHANVSQHGINIPLKRMDFLWVHWFGCDLAHKGGWRARRLHRIGFVESQDPTAFGFLDPASVIWAVHLIPAFSIGKTVADVDPSHEDMDWQQYYVNTFVDRDMFIRFRGGGVGHKSTRKETDQFLSDRHVLDLAEETSCEGEVGEDAEKCFEDTEEESEEDDDDDNDDDDGDDDDGDDDSDDDSGDDSGNDDGDDDDDDEGVIEDRDVELDQDAGY
ncbi:hypothetical protein APHAL10511_000245 [Amanita phalloides]|nr:hypothetical protein APHAL10511_000245 [Amanita phalloides]